jgi:alginate O-acetyltransferase complex protein AlgI
MFLNGFFFFVLFPVSLLLYYLLPKQFHSTILIGTGVMLLAFCEMERCLVFLLYVLLTDICGKVMMRLRKKSWSARLLLCLHDMAYLVGLLFLRPPVEYHAFGISLYPIGISILSLRAISYLHHVFRQRQLYEQNGKQFALYACFYPTLSIGGVTSFSKFHYLQQHRVFSATQVSTGLRKWICGLAKYALVGGQFSLMLQQMEANNAIQPTVFFTWLYYALHFLYFILIVTSYTDMAEGIAACYGYRLPRSSRKPIWNRRLSVFLRNWNRTIHSWFLSFFQVFPHRRRNAVPARLLLAWAVCGWFYRGRLTSLLWGLCIGIALLLSECCHRKWHYIPRALEWCCVIGFWILGWSLFCSDTIADALTAWKALFGSSGVLVTYENVAFLGTHIWLLLLAFFCTTGLLRKGLHVLSSHRKTAWLVTIGTPLVDAGLLLCCVVAINNSSIPNLLLQW